MNKGITTKIKNALGQEIERYPVILTALETMEKHGYQCICMNKEELLSYQGQVVRLKRLVLTFVVPTGEKSISFSTYQDLERLTRDCTKYSKKLKTEWCLITDTTVGVVMSEEQK